MTEDSIELRDQVGVLRRRWRVVAATLLAALAVGLLVLLVQTPLYVASARVLLADTADGQAPSGEQIATEARAVTLGAPEVVDQLALPDSPEDLFDTVTVSPDPDGAAVITIAATRTDPGEAAAIANALAEQYIGAAGSRTSDRVAALDSDIEQLDGQIGSLRLRLDQARQAVDNAQDPTDARERVQDLRSVLRRAIAQRGQLIDARSQQIVNSRIQGQGAVILSPATVPESPVSPDPLQVLGLAAVVGLLVGVGLAYLRDYFDDVIRDEASLGDELAHYPVLATISHVRGRAGALGITRDSPGAPASEAYHGLEVSLRSIADGTAQASSRRAGAGIAVLVSSATAGEGKTSTATNLAVVAAGAGQRVVLVDAHLRRPALHVVFGQATGPGLVDVLAGGASASAALTDVGVEGLRVLPAGGVPANPADLMASAALVDLLALLRQEADVVVVDGASLLEVSDALDLARSCDLSLLVVRAGTARERDATDAVRRVARVGGAIDGLVLNDVSSAGSRRNRRSRPEPTYAGTRARGASAPDHRDSDHRDPDHGDLPRDPAPGATRPGATHDTQTSTTRPA